MRTPEEQRKLDDRAIQKALGIIRARLREPGVAFTSPVSVKDYGRLTMGDLQREEFRVLYLDVKNRLVADELAFIGTLTSATVHPREIARRALVLNVNAVIVLHNHPSGDTEPSEADRTLTGALKAALSVVDVRVLDHIIVAGLRTYSFAEQGLL